MPEVRVLADTGPLVALLVAEDAFHSWAVEQFQELPAPFLTCEPVLTECFHLLYRLPEGSKRFFELLDRGLLTVNFGLLSARGNLKKLVQKYADLPMSLADACLVHMAELNPKASVFTVDRHFLTYRKHGRQAIPTVMPPGR